MDHGGLKNLVSRRFRKTTKPLFFVVFQQYSTFPNPVTVSHFLPGPAPTSQSNDEMMNVVNGLPLLLEPPPNEIQRNLTNNPPDVKNSGVNHARFRECMQFFGKPGSVEKAEAPTSP